MDTFLRSLLFHSNFTQDTRQKLLWELLKIKLANFQFNLSVILSLCFLFVFLLVFETFVDWWEWKKLQMTATEESCEVRSIFVSMWKLIGYWSHPKIETRAYFSVNFVKYLAKRILKATTFWHDTLFQGKKNLRENFKFKYFY